VPDDSASGHLESGGAFVSPLGVSVRICDGFSMQEPNLRVIKWVGTGPAVAGCNHEFRVSVSSMKRVSVAQQVLKNAFVEHECTSEKAQQ
jgi:hypothetical protein